ncbi:MAG: hypothetical protein R3F35_22370 [Myxococcota bacterium]
MAPIVRSFGEGCESARRRSLRDGAIGSAVGVVAFSVVSCQATQDRQRADPPGDASASPEAVRQGAGDGDPWAGTEERIDAGSCGGASLETSAAEAIVGFDAAPTFAPGPPNRPPSGAVRIEEMLNCLR